MGRERTPPGDATQSGHTEDNPAPSTVAPGARGVPCSPTTVSPRPPNPIWEEEGEDREGERARQQSLPSAPESGASRWGDVMLRGWAGATFHPGPLQADPEPVAVRRRGSAPDGGRGSNGRQSPPRMGGRIRRPGMAANRWVEPSGRTARTPPVYLLTVSHPLELSLQSSFQLSLTVLVGYRSRAGI
ncbi:UNVERIFIED_CONTAM: hypothetical protein FKN15_011677 [Acipenser sinensis]